MVFWGMRKGGSGQRNKGAEVELWGVEGREMGFIGLVIRPKLGETGEKENPFCNFLGMENGKSEQEVAEQDLLFHSLIAKASGNEIIEWVFHMMQETYSRIFADNVTHLGKTGAEQHRRILLDIQIRDMDAARQHMIAHLDTTVRSVCKP